MRVNISPISLFPIMCAHLVPILLTSILLALYYIPFQNRTISSLIMDMTLYSSTAPF